MQHDLFNDQPLSFEYILKTDNNWTLFKSLSAHKLRPETIQEVEKMLLCCNPQNGFATFICTHCGHTKKIHFSCKSKSCCRCGKKYTDNWSNELNSTLLHTTHMHIILTVSDKLWNPLQLDISLQKLLLDSAAKTISKVFSLYNKQKLKITTGTILVLHPFGDDLSPNFHVHAITTTGGLSKNNSWVNADFIPYDAFRKIWQYEILTALRKQRPDLTHVIDCCFKSNSNGFLVFCVRKIHPNKRSLLKYLSRYVRHPAISNRRIIAYNGTHVTFSYEKYGKKSYKTIPKFDFILAVLQHITPKHFKVIRRLGLYSRRSKTKYNIASELLQPPSSNNISASTFNWRRNKMNFSGSDPIKCERCNHQMELLSITYPTKTGYKTVGGFHWIIREGGLNYVQHLQPPQKHIFKEQKRCSIHMSKL